MESEFMLEENMHDVMPPPHRTMEMQKCFEDYRRLKNDLVKSAAAARDDAVSHRGFKVGCAILGLAPKPGYAEYGMYFGYNITPTPRKRVGKDKRCAERNAVEGYLRDVRGCIVALVTVSKETSTGDEVGHHDVLHPCSTCLDMLHELREDGVLRGDSIICCVNDEKGVEEEKTIDELLTSHNDEVQRVA